jgi:hypothetical protein
MFIDDLRAEKTHLGTITDNIVNNRLNIWIKKIGPFNGFTEYKIDFKSDNEAQTPVGYLKFVPGLHGIDDYVMSALKTDENFRGQNLSDAFLETLFQYAEFNNTHLSSAVQQRKPLTAFILSKYGFEPVDNRPRDVVEIMGRYGDNDMLVAFRDSHKRREFEASNLCQNSQQYVIVEPNLTLALDKVTLLTPYLLTDTGKCDQRRNYIQRRFSIKFKT